MLIEQGKAYRKEGEGGRIVTAIENGVVTYLLPATCRLETCTLAEMQAWAEGEYVRPGSVPPGED